MTTELTIAANNGDLGGGEVMLLRIAEAARADDLRVRVVGPAGELIQAATELGFPSVAIASRNRPEYLRGLRRWDRDRRGLLWCNGLVPALSTSGRPDRLIHLHQRPQNRAQRMAYRAARIGSLRTVVPSASMAGAVPGSAVLANWTEELPLLPRRTRPNGPAVIGFLGRMSQDKGLDVLAAATGKLPSDVVLRVTGDSRYVPARQQRAVAAALALLGARVERTGWLPRKKFFAGVDLAVFPSVWPEPFGLVVAEAMALGVPFVISDAGALSEVAGPGHPWVARAGDSDHLAEVIWAALGTDPTEPTVQARARWVTEFSPAAGAHRVQALLTQLEGTSR